MRAASFISHFQPKGMVRDNREAPLGGMAAWQVEGLAGKANYTRLGLPRQLNPAYPEAVYSDTCVWLQPGSRQSATPIDLVSDAWAGGATAFSGCLGDSWGLGEDLGGD